MALTVDVVEYNIDTLAECLGLEPATVLCASQAKHASRLIRRVLPPDQRTNIQAEAVQATCKDVMCLLMDAAHDAYHIGQHFGAAAAQKPSETNQASALRIAAQEVIEAFTNNQSDLTERQRSALEAINAATGS